MAHRCHGPPSSAHTLLGPCREKAVASRLPRALGSDQQLSWALQTPEHPQRLSLPLLSGPGALAPAGRTAQPPLPAPRPDGQGGHKSGQSGGSRSAGSDVAPGLPPPARQTRDIWSKAETTLPLEHVLSSDPISKFKVLAVDTGTQ